MPPALAQVRLPMLAVAIIAATMLVAGCSAGLGSGAKRVDGAGAIRDRTIQPRNVEPGSAIAYVDAGDLWLVDIDGSDDPVRLTHANGAVTDIAWSSDAQRLAYVQSRPGRCCNEKDEIEYACCPALRVLDFDAGRDHVMQREVIRFKEMHFSPTGKLSWSSSRQAPEARTTSITTAAHSPAPSTNPTRSPDGRSTVTVAPATGATPARLLLGRIVRPGSGRAIGALAGGGPGSTDQEFTEFDPVWVGDRLVFAVRETWLERGGAVGDTRRIYLVDVAHGTTTLLVDDAPIVEQLVPAPDQRHAVGVFAAGEPAQRNLGALDLETGSITQLAHLESVEDRAAGAAHADAPVEIAPLPVAQVAVEAVS